MKTPAFPITRVVFGGQTGADRGGLDAALDLGVDCGGWAPRGWRAEDGAIPERYRVHMQEAPTADWTTRTAWNIRDSDGTIVFSFAARLTGGSAQTIGEARRQGKPVLHVVLSADHLLHPVTRAQILAWLDEHRIRVLNVAGPRRSKEPDIQAAVRNAVTSRCWRPHAGSPSPEKT